MAKKKVYAALEISDQETRLVVSELFEGRSNILRVEHADHAGMKNGKITDEASVIDSIHACCAQAQAALGYKIEKVLLAIPAIEVSRVSQIIPVTIDDGTHNARLFHVQQGLKKAVQKRLGDDLEMANVNAIDYSMNGQPLSKMPVGMETDGFEMDVDLLYADKETLYDYVKVVEAAGLQVLDICLDVYAQAMETGALAQSKDRSVILIDLEPDHTSLSLLMNGRLMSSARLEQGSDAFIKDLMEEYGLSKAAGRRLLHNLFSQETPEDSDMIIYIEQQDDRRVELTQSQLEKAIIKNLRSWIVEINEASRPILEQTKARYVLSGQADEIPVLSKMQAAFSAPMQVYDVTSIGAREGRYATALGLNYAWQNANRIWNRDTISVNNNELEASIESIGRYARDTDGGFTQKLKKVMYSNKN